eukprot:3937753-Rhodomonas_salina.1
MFVAVLLQAGALVAARRGDSSKQGVLLCVLQVLVYVGYQCQGFFELDSALVVQRELVEAELVELQEQPFVKVARADVP